MATTTGTTMPTNTVTTQPSTGWGVVTPPATALQTATVASIPNIKAQEFDPQDPELWFGTVEAQFTNFGIVTEKDMFNRVIPLIDVKYTREARDIILHPPLTTPYQTFKNTLISAFSKSRQANLIQLLDREQLGSRTPSQHLRHLKALVSDVDGEVLKARWLSHLPQQTQMCLANQDGLTLDTLAERADLCIRKMITCRFITGRK